MLPREIVPPSLVVKPLGTHNLPGNLSGPLTKQEADSKFVRTSLSQRNLVRALDKIHLAY
jgi:hypothetical protein